MADPATLNTLQFLAWVAREQRTYGDVQEVWRSTCPRLTAWEDALDEALVEFARGAGRVGDRTPVRLTERGRRLLAQ